MNKIIKFVFILIILFFACNKQEDIIEKKLRGDDYKYWLVYKNYPSFKADSIFPKDEYLFIDYFDKNGKYFLFYKRNLTSDFKKDSDYSVSDIVNNNTWYLKDNSLLIVNGIDNEIKTIKDDMMILYNPYNKQYTLYIAAPESLIPQEYRTLQ